MSLIPDSYLTIAKPAEGLYKDKGSKFISWAYPVKDLEEIKSHLASLKEAHPKARHICYAYRLGFTPEEARSNDDGEPSGSAGKPILNTILSQNLHYVLVAVVRYFGGTMLGIPGLIEAYGSSAKLVLDQSGLIEKFMEEKFTISGEFQHEQEIHRLLNSYQVRISNREYTERVTYEVFIRKGQAIQFEKQAKESYLLDVKSVV